MHEWRGKHGVIWRGQADEDWRLTSSAFRLHEAEVLRRSAGEKDVLEDAVSDRMGLWGPGGFISLFNGLKAHPEYSLKLSAVLQKNPAELTEEEQVELWAVGQHHGLRTPLLDWSRSPYVALFFACAGVIDHQDDQMGNLAIYGICPDIIARPLHREGVRFFALSPKLSLTPRLIAQQGFLTMMFPDGDLLGRIEKCKPAGRNESEPEIYKITLPKGQAWECLEHLQKMNISYKTLMPDIEGICRFGNWAARSASYTGTMWGGTAWGFNFKSVAEPALTA